jgi:NADH dehydrogenase FAD-containing subunit
MQNKKNIVVLGAGCAGITVVLHLAHPLKKTAEYQIHLVDEIHIFARNAFARSGCAEGRSDDTDSSDYQKEEHRVPSGQCQWN